MNSLSPRQKSGLPNRVVEQADNSTLLPMTAAQQGIYFECLRRGSLDYTVSVELQVNAIPESRLRAAVARILVEQPALRSTVSVERNGVYYKVARHVDPPIVVHDLHLDEAADDIASALVEAPFNFKTGPLIRIAHCRLADADRLLITCHHLVADGQSLSTFAARLVDLVFDTDGQLDTPLVEADGGFSAYQQRRSRALSPKQHDRADAYWRDALARQDAPNLAHWILPETDISENDALGHELRIPVDAALNGRLRELAMAAEVSEHTVYLSAFGLLLAHYANTDSVSVAMPFTDRPGIEEADSIGCFLSTVPVHLDADRAMTVRAMLESASAEVLGAWRNIGYPVAELLGEYPALADVFDITFIQDTYPALPEGVERLRRRARVPFPGRFTVLVEHLDGCAELVFQYKPGALTESEVRRFGDRFLALLERLPTALDASLGELAVMSDSELAQLHAQLADTHYFDWEPANLGRLFLDKTSSAPGRTAWRDADREYSNAWAHDAAVRVQRCLLDMTGGVNRPIAIQLPRSAELLASVYGVLLAGCHYVPLADNEPAQRVQQILDDAGIEVVITTSPSTSTSTPTPCCTSSTPPAPQGSRRA